MTFTAEQIIVTRLLKEVDGLRRLALGKRIPRLLYPHLGSSCELVPLDRIKDDQTFDAVVVEARQVSQRGDISLFPEDLHSEKIEAERWIVATPHFNERGEGKLVEAISERADCHECADLVITELGVISISRLGFELREVAPGRSSDDVRSAVRASLHVVDDLELMRLES